MNVNEFVATLASRVLHGDTETARQVYPNDDVNLGQSSNDVFPSVMHIAVAGQTKRSLLPTLDQLRSALAAKALAFRTVIRIGRTHLQEATLLTLG